MPHITHCKQDIGVFSAWVSRPFFGVVAQYKTTCTHTYLCMQACSCMHIHTLCDRVTNASVAILERSHPALPFFCFTRLFLPTWLVGGVPFHDSWHIRHFVLFCVANCNFYIWLFSFFFLLSDEILWFIEAKPKAQDKCVDTDCLKLKWLRHLLSSESDCRAPKK